MYAYYRSPRVMQTSGACPQGLIILLKKGRTLSWRIEKARWWAIRTSMFAFDSALDDIKSTGIELIPTPWLGSASRLPRKLETVHDSTYGSESLSGYGNVNIASGLIRLASLWSHTFKFSAKLVLILGTL